MARVEITLIFEDLPDGKQAQTITGVKYEGEANGMQGMTELGPHACFAFTLAMVHSFHVKVDEQAIANKPKVQIARMGRG